MINKDNFIHKFIEHCENTDPEDWMEGVCRSTDQTKNCLLGQIYKLFNDDTELSNEYVDFFEYHYATTYMFFPVNDGENPDYQQSNARDRCIAYLRDLRDGKAKTTLDYMKEYDKNSLI